MAADEPTCPLCGKPLIGKERFEGKCAACREREVLGEPAVAADEAPAGASGRTCGACGAENPPGRGRCVECGARLGRRWTRLAASCVVAAVVVGGALAVAVLATRSRSGRRSQAARPARATSLPAGPTRAPAPDTTAPPSPRPSRAHLVPRVRDETRTLVALLRGKDYARVIDNYCQPDEEEFARLQGLLDKILRGDASAAFARWSATLIPLAEADARERLRAAGAPCPDYATAFLAHVRRDPDVSSSHRSSEDRARAVLAWHIAGVFDGIDLARAEIRHVEDPGQGPFTVELACEGKATQPRPGDDPRRIRWARRPVGWVVQLAAADRLEGIYDFLKTAPTP